MCHGHTSSCEYAASAKGDHGDHGDTVEGFRGLGAVTLSLTLCKPQGGRHPFSDTHHAQASPLWEETGLLAGMGAWARWGIRKKTLLILKV